MGDLLTTVGRRVRSAREELGLTQDQLAERAGLHVSYVGQIERGLREPSLRSLAAVATALNLQLADLLAADPPKEGRLLRELERVVDELKPPQQRELLEVVRRVVQLAGGRRRRK
jgi:transcriptional regulator with XRE-family HTH domain